MSREPILDPLDIWCVGEHENCELGAGWCGFDPDHAGECVCFLCGEAFL